MSRMEKIEAMHLLWEDLARDDGLVESPSWHATVLKETEARVLDGTERVYDWEEAKRELRKR